MIYVLIVVLNFGRVIEFHEFNSLATCQTAAVEVRKALKVAEVSPRGYNVVCVAK